MHRIGYFLTNRRPAFCTSVHTNDVRAFSLLLHMRPFLNGRLRFTFVVDDDISTKFARRLNDIQLSEGVGGYKKHRFMIFCCMISVIY